MSGCVSVSLCVNIFKLEYLRNQLANRNEILSELSYLQVTRKSIPSRTSSKFCQIGPRTTELAALERLEKSTYTYNGSNLVNTLAPSFLIRSSSFLQVTRTCIKAWMSSNFSQIPPPTPELSAFARLKN